MANRNFASAGKIYSMHVMPVLLDCNFIVDSTNGNGLGIRSLKGPAIENVYMHTSATPAAGNPNPSPGYIVVQLQDNYNRSLSGFNAIASPIGSTSGSTTAGTPAIVITLGTSTAAQWLAVGFPSQYLNSVTGLPNVGAAFVPTSSASIGGSATIAPASTSGLQSFETIGDPNQTISSTSPQLVGSQIIIQCLSSTGLTTPANGTVISLAFLLNNSSIVVQGE
jgi:hypothetical protein